MKNFKPTTNRTALISNELIEVHRYNLGLNAQKLLIGLAQSIDHTIDLFPEMQVDIHGLWEYLGITHREDRYTLVRDALFEITKNPLQIVVSEKKWSSIPWMSVKYDESESRYVRIKFHEDAKPYLLKLNEYTKIKGLYVVNLNSAYATWLYPILKMVQTKYHGSHTISIQRLKEYTFTDNPKESPAYNIGNSSTNNFLRKVLGIAWNPKRQEFEVIKNSPLWEINEKTDIIVSAGIVKEGRKYSAVSFHVVSKYTNEQKAIHERNGIKNQYVNEIPKEGLQAQTRIPLTTVYSLAKAQNTTVAELCERLGYILKDGYAVKKMTKEQYEKMQKAKEKEESKRGYRQMTIEEVIRNMAKK